MATLAERAQFAEIKERLRSILHAMSEVILSLSREGELRYITPAAEALLGVPLRSISSLHDLFARVHPEDLQAVRQYYASLQESEFDEMEYRIITPSGQTKWVHDEGHTAYCPDQMGQRIDHVLRDVTARRQAMDALASSEARYRDFFHSTHDMAYSVRPDGVFLDINEAGARMLGFCSRDEALGANIRDFYEDPAERERILAEIQAHGAVHGRHVRMKTRDGRIIEVDLTARAKRNPQGVIVSYEGIITNITELLENQRNQVLRQAAGSVCHYLNTHLMQILAAKDGILEEIESSADPAALRQAIRAYCQDLEAACAKITAVTRAFNSAFLTYKEEPYLDHAIIAIFDSLKSEAACPPPKSSA
ncbi:MAG: PAS domain S-box protein [Desulfomicrobiaceae bacterium]|nr:PAS domain S-box protein [Desulfomicrobiaceae bacterium]